MFRVSHCYRVIVHSALAVLVVAALSRCSWEESRELAQWMGVLAHHRLELPSPVQSPIHDCDRESGCICRGATQVHALDVTHFKANPVDLLAPDLSDVPVCWVADDLAAAWSSAIDHELSVPPICGRQLRALYASLVI